MQSTVAKANEYFIITFILNHLFIQFSLSPSLSLSHTHTHTLVALSLCCCDLPITPMLSTFGLHAVAWICLVWVAFVTDLWGWHILGSNWDGYLMGVVYRVQNFRLVGDLWVWSGYVLLVLFLVVLMILLCFVGVVLGCVILLWCAGVVLEFVMVLCEPWSCSDDLAFIIKNK